MCVRSISLPSWVLIVNLLKVGKWLIQWFFVKYGPPSRPLAFPFLLRSLVESPGCTAQPVLLSPLVFSAWNRIQGTCIIISMCLDLCTKVGIFCWHVSLSLSLPSSPPPPPLSSLLFVPSPSFPPFPLASRTLGGFVIQVSFHFRICPS